MMSAALLTALTVIAALGPVGGRPRRTVGPIEAACSDTTTAFRRRHHVRQLTVAAGVLVAVLVLGLVPAAALLVGAGVAPRVRRLLATRTTQRAIDAALPDAIEMLILVIQTGMTPHQAIDVLTHRAPAPVRPAFIEVRHRVERGAPLADALGALPDTLGQGAAAVADTLAMAERHGTPIAQALEQLSLDVRERRRRRAESEARKLPIRMSFPLVACTLPSFVLIAIVPAVLAAMASLGNTGF
jgi:tight adherence protein C